MPIFQSRAPISKQMERAIRLLAITVENEEHIEQLLNNLLSVVIMVNLKAEKYLDDFEELLNGETIPSRLQRVIRKRISFENVFEEKDLMNVVKKIVKKGDFSFEVIGKGSCAEVEIRTKKTLVLPNMAVGCLKKDGGGLKDRLEDIYLGNLEKTLDFEMHGVNYHILQLPAGKVVKRKHIVISDKDALLYTGEEIMSVVNCSDDRGNFEIKIETGAQLSLKSGCHLRMEGVLHFAPFKKNPYYVNMRWLNDSALNEAGERSIMENPKQKIEEEMLTEIGNDIGFAAIKEREIWERLDKKDNFFFED